MRKGMQSPFAKKWYTTALEEAKRMLENLPEESRESEERNASARSSKEALQVGKSGWTMFPRKNKSGYKGRECA